MAYAFNINHLKSLELRNCPGTLSWLRTILNHEDPTNLKSLELAFDLHSCRRDEYMHITETACDFIQHVSGLESLFLMLPEPFNWTPVAERLSGHNHLRGFAMQHLVDRGGQRLVDGELSWPLPLERILQGNQLTCFGSSIPPGKLVCLPLSQIHMTAN